MRRRSWMLLLVAAAIGCPQGRGRPVPDVGPQPKPKFERPGRCFGKPSKCEIDAHCAPPFSTCQEGTCCSGTLDPETCKCTCGGATCEPDQLCCAGGDWSDPETRGRTMCRSKGDCFGPF